MSITLIDTWSLQQTNLACDECDTIIAKKKGDQFIKIDNIPYCIDCAKKEHKRLGHIIDMMEIFNSVNRIGRKRKTKYEMIR